MISFTTGVSCFITGVIQETTEGQWIQEFKDYGIETFFWMVNSSYLYDLAGELGFTWATTDFRDVIKK